MSQSKTMHVTAAKLERVPIGIDHYVVTCWGRMVGMIIPRPDTHCGWEWRITGLRRQGGQVDPLWGYADELEEAEEGLRASFQDWVCWAASEGITPQTQLFSPPVWESLSVPRHVHGIEVRDLTAENDA